MILCWPIFFNQNNAAILCVISFGEHGIIVLKVKVEDLKGLLTQKHGMIVMKEDPKGLGGSLNIQEYLLLLCYTLQIGGRVLHRHVSTV